mgnify:CR=1 FL=1
MTTLPGFATHGEVLKFLYNAFGVMPRKEVRSGAFDEKNKKTLQKQLARLAVEEGSLVENFQKAVSAFCELVGEYLPLQDHFVAMAMVIQDLDAIHAGIIRTEGTYLDKHASIRYLVSVQMVPGFVWTMNRSILLCGLWGRNPISEDDPFWYLPSRDTAGRLTMPLAKTMQWVYRKCAMSQSQFHSPGKLREQAQQANQQNLETAINWTRGKGLPSLPALTANFKESFAAQSARGRVIDPALQQNMFCNLVYARVATYIAREIQETYGDAYLDDVCAQFRQLKKDLDVEVVEFARQVAPVMEKQPTRDRASDTWRKACADHARFVRDKLSSVEAILFELLEQGHAPGFDSGILEPLKRRFGNFAVHSVVDRIERQAKFKMPERFDELLFAGIDLRKEPGTTLQDIDNFEQHLRDAGLQETLCWLPPWLRGVFYYRKEDFATAFQHYEAAFDLAKYRAGNMQYKLVNQFIELAAKNDKAVAFKKGVDWAAYIGVELRWLRDKEPTQENLDFMRFMMKRANYTHQL